MDTHVDLTVLTWRTAGDSKSSSLAPITDTDMANSVDTIPTAPVSSLYVSPLLTQSRHGYPTARRVTIRIPLQRMHVNLAGNTVPMAASMTIRSRHTIHVWYSNDGTRLYIGMRTFHSFIIAPMPCHAVLMVCL